MSHVRVGVALVAAIAIAGCGSGSKSSVAASKAPTKAQGEAAGKAINLTVSDLPSGFTSEPADNSDDTKAEEKALAACAGASAPGGELADIRSDDFSKGEQVNQQKASSEVTVVADLAVAKNDVKAYQGSKTETCLKTFVTDVLSKQAGEGGVTFGPPTIASLATDPDGTAGGFGYIITTTASAAGVKIPFEIVIQAFLVKHTEVALTTFAIGGPFSAEVRAGLLSALVKRAKANAV